MKSKTFVFLIGWMVFVPHGFLFGCSAEEVEPSPLVECLAASPQGCYETDCDPGYECRIPQEECIPLDCFCDTRIGEWHCAMECGGGVCVPEEEACEGENPAGCAVNGCDDGLYCEVNAGCAPSACECVDGEWDCAPDCLGGVCLPEDNTCGTDNDCAPGVQWCEQGECVECDNSGLVCDIDCGEGYELEARNGCFPCNCVPVNECRSDDDCEGDDVCQAGDMCFFWCEAGDPTCCYGNTCVAP